MCYIQSSTTACVSISDNVHELVQSLLTHVLAGTFPLLIPYTVPQLLSQCTDNGVGESIKGGWSFMRFRLRKVSGGIYGVEGRKEELRGFIKGCKFVRDGECEQRNFCPVSQSTCESENSLGFLNFFKSKQTENIQECGRRFTSLAKPARRLEEDEN